TAAGPGTGRRPGGPRARGRRTSSRGRPALVPRTSGQTSRRPVVRGRPWMGPREGLWYGTVGRQEGLALVRFIVQEPAGSGHHRGQRVLGELDGNLAVVGQAHVEPPQLRSSTGQE